MSNLTDTINLIPKKSRQYIVNEAAKKAEQDKKDLDKKIRQLERKGDSLGIVKLLTPEVKFLDYKLTSGSSLSIYAQISLSFKEPVSFLSDTAIHIYQKIDTIWNPIPFEIEHDTINILKYDIYAEWKPEQTFKITIDSASIQGLYGLHNGPIQSTIKFNALDKYSTLTVNVANPKPTYTVRLHNKGGAIVNSGTLENGSVDFFLLPPSTYYISMFDDTNENGKWDTGDYNEKRHAERVWYIPRSWALKQDWTHETEAWNVDEIPLVEQKPDDLHKEKSKKKVVDIHKKNLDRLEKKANQKESEKKKKERKRQERKARREYNKEKYRALRAKAKEKNNAAAGVPEESDTDVSSPDIEEIDSPKE